MGFFCWRWRLCAGAFKDSICWSKKTVLDLFSLEDHLIAEHWDAIQDEQTFRLNNNSAIEEPITIEDKNLVLKNKTLVNTFYQEVFIKKNFQALPNFIIKDLIQHNPKIKDGIEYFKTYLGFCHL